MFRALSITASFILLLTSCREATSQAQRSLQTKGIPLHAAQVNLAVARGDETSLEQLLLCGVFANQCDEHNKTPLQYACESSDFRMVRLLLQYGANPNITTQTTPPLTTAALHGDIAVAKALLKHGASANTTAADGKPLLHWCIEHGRFIIADALLQHGADLHATDRFGNNARAYALQYKRRHLAERMLTLGADPGRATKPEGAFTPAIIRCLKLDWLDLLPALVKSGADLNATDHHGSTALDYATASSDSKKWQLLLDLYQDPNATIADGRSLLEWSLSFDESVSLRLLEKGAKPTNQNAPNICPLSHAVVEKKRTLCEALLSREATLSTASSPESATLISRAIEHGWHDLIERLVIAGADINTPNSEGKSPALVALDQGHTDLFQTLIRLGARSPKTTWAESLQDAISLSNTNKLRTLLAAGIRPAADSDAPAQLLSSALTLQNAETLSILLEHQIHHPALYHLASRSGRTDVLRLLEKHSVKYDASFDSTYDHPIHAAIHSGCLDTLQHLLQHHQDIHILGKANQTPLVCAIARHRHDMVKLLLQYKADPNRLLENKANAEFLSLFTNNGIRWYLTFDRNLTPLMIAADSGRVNIARTLLEHGAKLGTWTAVNKTWPLNFACRKADVPMMRLLLRKDPYIETQHIVVNLARQDAQLFDSCGNVVFTTKISTGKKGFATPTGIFVITNKYREWRSTIYNGASMPCFQRFSCGDFGFHQGVVPGYPASHGCLRVPYGNAQKLFALTQIGDRVVIE